VKNSLENLQAQSIVHLNKKNQRYSITSKGRSIVVENRSTRELEKNQALQRFQEVLKCHCEATDETSVQKCVELASETLLIVFKNRGLSIANQVFSGHSPDSGELTDIFKYISKRAAEIGDFSLQSAFMLAMHQFLIEPTVSQKKFLASISQGFFMYHYLGCDPSYIRTQREIFQKTIWFFDTSVLLPFIAKGCVDHEYAGNLFSDLLRQRALLFTTENFLREAWAHLRWAREFVKEHRVDSSEFLRAVLLKGSYRQNLFLEGYIRLSAKGLIGSFDDYLNDLFAEKEITHNSFNEFVESLGIKVIRLSTLSGFAQNDWGELKAAEEELRDARENRGTLRSDLQVESEAEIWTIIKKMRSNSLGIEGQPSFEKVYFVSQSPIIDRVFSSNEMTTWTAETLYRYVSALPGNQVDPDLFQQCLLHEYYYAGISYIDKDLYLKFFGPSIDATKKLFANEIEKYKSGVEETYKKDIEIAFDNTPDLEKPFFLSQMGWRLVSLAEEKESKAKERSQEAMQQLLEAKAKIKHLENEKEQAWKKREIATAQQEMARIRNLQDPKHKKKLRRQAKKKRKKK